MGCAAPEAPGSSVDEPERIEPARAPLVEVDASSLDALIDEHDGHPLLLNVWSTWCEPCAEELPGILRVAREHRARGLRLVLISTDPPVMREAASAFLHDLGAPEPSYLRVGPDDPFIRAVDAHFDEAEWSGALPLTLLFDESGSAADVWLEPVQEQALARAVDSVLATGGTESTAREETR